LEIIYGKPKSTAGFNNKIGVRNTFIGNQAGARISQNSNCVKDNIFIDQCETGNELLEYGIKNNMYDLCEFVFESKSYKIDLDKYIDFERIINNKEMYLLFIKAFNYIDELGTIEKVI
jgi:hypothetical protein